MSTLIQPTRAPAPDRASPTTASDYARDRTRRRVWLFVMVLVLAWSAMELANLGLNHTTGAELYGVAVAAVAIGTGVLSLVLLASRRVLARAAVLVLWAVIAVGGIAGAAAHIVGPGTGHGPVDTRSRPVAAPLIFTALGLVGGAALFYGERAGRRRVREP